MFVTSLLSRRNPRFLISFSWGARCLYGPEGTFSSCGQCDVNRHGSISLFFPFFKQFWIAARLVSSFCEAMAGSLSVASTAVLLAKVAVV
jgi:hypothetical protein